MSKLMVSLISLLIGGLIYIFWRSETLMMFTWFNYLGLTNFYSSIRADVSGLSIFIPNWFTFSLPNALWLFSGLLIFDLIWGPKVSIAKLAWFFIFGIIAVGAELGQALLLLPGTFDLQDLALMIIASFCAFLFIFQEKQKDRGEGT